MIMVTTRILGIDPGFAIIGWAVIDKNGPSITLKAYGAITTEKNIPIEKRLLRIFQELEILLQQHKPQEVAIEQLYFSTNAKTAIDVAQARGVIVISCAKEKLPVVSYSPLAVKKTLTGDGKAEKRQVQFMLTKILKIKEAPKPDDVADAVAIALTHAYTHRY